MTVTFQLRPPKNPTIIKMDAKQLINGKETHFRFLNTIQRIKIINANTPMPNITISFFINVIMSSAIMGIPLNLISAN